MKVIAKYYGGSHSYGLANERSDLDERYLFLNTEVSKIIGLDRHEHQCRQNESEDSFGWELRHFLNLLRKGNTGAIELLYNDKWLVKEKEFEAIQTCKELLIDSDKLFTCLVGYCHSERRFVLGERTGKLGGKRFEALQKYGYSHKNLVQYLRLCYAGVEFFQSGIFPVDAKGLPVFDLLFDIKNNPENYLKENAIKYMDEALKELHNSYNKRKIDYGFDDDVANTLCVYMYYPFVNEAWHYENMKGDD